MPLSQEPIRDDVERWLSEPRYARYREAAGEDDEAALGLYLWNIGLAQAVLRDVSFFEVALRNAYDRCIAETWCGDGHWLFDEASPVRRPIFRTNRRRQINDANRINRNTIDRLRDGLGEGASPDDVISNLTLGFWAHMTDRNHERDLWIPAIHRAWPSGTERVVLNRAISSINAVRNRAAHHERLFGLQGGERSTAEACADAVALFRLLAPAAANYVYGRDGASSVASYLGCNPAPCDVII